MFGPLTTAAPVAARNAAPKSLRPALLRRSQGSCKHDHTTSGIGRAMIGRYGWCLILRRVPWALFLVPAPLDGYLTIRLEEVNSCQFSKVFERSSKQFAYQEVEIKLILCNKS